MYFLFMMSNLLMLLCIVKLLHLKIVEHFMQEKEKNIKRVNSS